MTSTQSGLGTRVCARPACNNPLNHGSTYCSNTCAAQDRARKKSLGRLDAKLLPAARELITQERRAELFELVGQAGIPVLTDNIRVADEDNPKGYYEFEAVKRTRKDASWVKAAPGKRAKVTRARRPRAAKPAIRANRARVTRLSKRNAARPAKVARAKRVKAALGKRVMAVPVNKPKAARPVKAARGQRVKAARGQRATGTRIISS